MINGFFHWGTDGYSPYNQVNEIKFTIQNDLFVIPELLYQDIFNVNDSYVVYKKENVYFVHSRNSDGAGSYDIVWVINDKGLIEQRFIGSYY